MTITFDSVAPVIPVRDLEVALDRYRRLGFAVHASDGPERYGFVDRGAVSLHLTEDGHHDSHVHGVTIYLYVSDADALYSQWSAAAVLGRFVQPHDTPYGLREFAFVDDDGTAHRIGSPVATSPT